MATIPLAWLISVLCVLIGTLVLSQPRLPFGARLLFASALAAVALVTGLVGLRTVYGVSTIAQLQPHVALLTTPSVWLGFHALTRQDGTPAPRTLLSHGAVLLIAECTLALPLSWSTDLVVALVNVVYIVLMARMLRLPPEAFVHITPDNFRSLKVALAGAIGFFSLILLADVSILAAVLSAGEAAALQFLTGATGVLAGVALIGAVVGLPLMLTPQPSHETTEVEPSEDDRHLLDSLTALMDETQIFRDPNLTLARLGRRMGCPARSVSEAVNRATGENISRFINGHRISYAAKLLQTSNLPVTEVMLEAGFVSKSSFNAEFRRVTGKTPSQYRKSLQDPS